MMKKSKGITCSTPEYHNRSPLRDSDSEGASPVPFLCTQDGAEGLTDVIWNYYTPTSKQATKSRVKNSTPLTTKKKRSIIPKRIHKSAPKRRTKKVSQEKPDYMQELNELNQNLYSLIENKAKNCVLSVDEKEQPVCDEDIFDETWEYSPKSGPRMNSNSLRKNLLNSNFNNIEPEAVLESDDSINECLLKASQAVEECLKKNKFTSIAKNDLDPKTLNNKTKNASLMNVEINNDSMDAIINSIKLDSPLVRKAKNCDSPSLYDDSFDNLLGNLNDSIIDRLTQMPSKNETVKEFGKVPKNETDWTVAELVVHDGSSSSKTLIRHSSMPESPLMKTDKPTTSGTGFGRYKTMPHNNKEKNASDSPIKCTPEEIKIKHQQAKEKLLAKRQLPFTSQGSHNINTTKISPSVATKKAKFEPKVPSSFKATNILPVSSDTQRKVNSSTNTNTLDQKLLIEKKRQEALMKLRSRQPHRRL